MATVLEKRNEQKVLTEVELLIYLALLKEYGFITAKYLIEQIRINFYL